MNEEKDAAGTGPAKATWEAPEVRSLDTPDINIGDLYEIPEGQVNTYDVPGSGPS